MISLTLHPMKEIKIVVQGDHSDAVLVLLRGLVKVTLDTDDGHEILTLP